MPWQGWVKLRVGLPQVAFAALALVVAVAVLASMDAEAKRYILNDGFGAPDGSDPDVNKWVVEADTDRDIVRVYNGHLTTWADGPGYAYCAMARPFSNDNVTVTVEFCVDYRDARCFDLVLLTGEVGPYRTLLSVHYENGTWGWDRLWQGSPDAHVTTVSQLATDRWHVAVLEAREGLATFSVRERVTGTSVFSFENLTIDPTGLRNLVAFGVDSLSSGVDPRTNWDNFTLVDPLAPPNVLPTWTDVPTLYAKEDVPFFYDFQRFIADDQEPWELELSSSSPYVVGVEAYEVQFLFPNNVTAPDVMLVVFDGYASVPKTVDFEVQPVNDPPSHSIPSMLYAAEGVPKVFDLSGMIWDEDDAKTSLHLVLSDPFIEVDGLMLMATFPEGMYNHTVSLGISDGRLTTYANIEFLVSPVNNPPRLATIGDMLVNEDEGAVLDLGPYIDDPDTPPGGLVVACSSDNCTVDGLVLTFLYTDGGFTEVVTVRVSDTVGSDEATFRVQVLPVNDPPRIADLPVFEVMEEEQTLIELADYVSDEETPQWELTLVCDDDHVTGLTWMGFGLLYMEGGFNDTIAFNVSDGFHVIEGVVRVHVVEVNDPPRLVTVGGMEAPVYLRVPTMTTRSYDIIASDGDDRVLYFGIESTWPGFTVVGETLKVTAGPLTTGDHIGYLNVYDGRGGNDRVKVVVHVVPRDSVPVGIVVVSPGNHSSYDPGDLITFRVAVNDPDGYLQGPTSVTWSSDIMGEIATLDLSRGGNLTTSDLDEGTHIIMVTVTDGTVSASDWIVVKVGDPEADTSVAGMSDACTVLAILAIVLVLGIIVGVAVHRAGRDLEPEPSPLRVGSQAEPEASDDREGVAAADRAWRAERVERAVEADRMEAEVHRRREEAREARIRSMERAEELRKAARDRTFDSVPAPEPREPEPTARAPPEAEPAPIARGGALPTDAEMEARRAAITMALERVGLPSTLDLYDVPTIAGRIVKGRKRWSGDGRLLAFLQGNWYYADPGDADFMRVYEE